MWELVAGVFTSKFPITISSKHSRGSSFFRAFLITGQKSVSAVNATQTCLACWAMNVDVCYIVCQVQFIIRGDTTEIQRRHAGGGGWDDMDHVHSNITHYQSPDPAPACLEPTCTVSEGLLYPLCGTRTTRSALSACNTCHVNYLNSTLFCCRCRLFWHCFVDYI